MIQRTNHNGVKVQNLQTAQEAGKTLAQHVEKINHKNKNDRLNIYETHLKSTSATYGEDIKQVMKKQKIEDNNLNANIIKTMNKSGLDITKSAVKTIVNQLQEEHLFKLFQNGYDIETLTVDIIAKEIIQSETAPISQDEAEEDAHSKGITQALADAGLSATGNNVGMLEQYEDKINSIIDHGDDVIPNMLRYKLDVTVNNLYTAKHKGAPKHTEEEPTQEEIIAVLNMNGIKVTQENMNAVSNLIKGNIEITKGNVKNYRDIRETIHSMDSDDLIKKATREMKKGENPGNTVVSPEAAGEVGTLEYDEVKQIIEDLQYIDETVIENTYKNEKPITIGSLQQTLHENVEKILKGGQVDQQDNVNRKEIDPDLTHKVSTTKRQLEEIRLSLTLEAALKLNNKLDIQTADLTKVVEELKVIENQHNEDILRNMGAPVTQENIEQMKQTSDKLYNLSQNKAFSTVQVVEGEVDFTLEGMDEGIKLKQAQDVYEETGSKPERRFGEGITRVEGQIEHILELNDIEATQVNIKAAKALVENNIDITKQEVETAKVVLLKIETVLHELRPAVVAQILQEGIRPDTMPIDDLIEHIRHLQKDNPIDPKQKVAEAILELDQTNQLNVKERDGLIAVYRMLNTITKNETAAIGFLLDNSKEPTLGNLFEASKYIKQVGAKTGKMDVTVNDDLGIREGKLPANIRSLIESATNLSTANLSTTGENADQWLSTKDVLDQWLTRITPEQLKSYLDMDKPLEELELQDGKLSPLESERTTEQVKALETLSPHTLTFLKEHNISLTIPHIYWTDKMIKNPYLLGDMLKGYEKLTGEKVGTSINNKDNKQNIEEILDKLEKELDAQSPKWLSATQSTQAYSMGKDMQQMLSTQKQISANEGMYQIPVQLHHGMSNLNVYVMKDKDSSNKVERDELRAHMSIKTQNIGIIQVNMRVSDKAVAFEMIGETPEITFGLQRGSKELQGAIEEIGFNVMQAKFSPGKTKTSLLERPEASQSLLKYRFEESKFEHII